MEQQSIQTPSNPFYLDELINTVNNNPTPKNILKMQQGMNQFKFDMGSSSPPLKEDGILGRKTMADVKDFRVMQKTNKEAEAFQSREDFDKKIEMQIEQVAKERMERFGRAKDRPSVFDMIKGNDSFDLRKEMEKDK